jgi:hypothetical protein
MSDRKHPSCTLSAHPRTSAETPAAISLYTHVQRSALLRPSLVGVGPFSAPLPGYFSEATFSHAEGFATVLILLCERLKEVCVGPSLTKPLLVLQQGQDTVRPAAD